jgi:Predicted ATPase (AAA+ superfamily)
VSGDQFAGRQTELSALENRMRDGINVVLSSPRRYGKTSLLTKATDDLLAEGSAVISVNVLACRDLPTFASRLANGAYAVRGGRWHKLKQAVGDFASRLRVSPTVTFDNDSPRFTFSASLAAEDADAVIEDVYGLLGELAAKQPAVIVLDEFQAISGLGEHLPALLKALADENPNVSLVIAGSKQHLMEQLTLDRGAPLYGLAERLSLDVLPETVMSDYLRERAKVGGKAMSVAAAERIIALAGPVPNDIQRLAYEAWGQAGRSVTADDVDMAMASAVEHEASQYSELYGRLSPGQRRVISTLAGRPVKEPYASEFARSVGLATGTSVRRALDALIADELVTRRQGHYQVFDPFFAAWLKQTL